MRYLWKARNKVARLYTMYYSIAHPVNTNKILFASFNGKQYSDNPRAISEKIHEICPQLDIVWFLNQPEDKYSIVPSYVKTVSDNRKLKFRLYRELATSFCFVTNANLETDIFKRRKQFFVQTWHGDRAFKKILYDSWEERKRPVRITDNDYTDVAVSGSSFGTQVYRSAFRYTGKVLECGSPRNDVLINLNCKVVQSIKDHLKLGNEKILLYAPTFRDKKHDKQKINVDLRRVIEVLEEKTNNKWICLIRSHPGACRLDDSQKDVVIDVSDYPDMADLLCITDFLLTDYSSSILDFYLTGRPSISFVSDEEEYEQECRGLKVKPADSGVVIAKSQEELEDIIRNYSEEDYTNAYKMIDKVYGTNESGEASLAVALAIIDHHKRTFAE